MKVTTGTTPVPLSQKKGFARFWGRFRKNIQLHIMILLPLLYLLIFEYAPMYGLQIAFRDYRIRDGIFGSEWVWFDNFIEFFSNYKWPDYVRNTLTISLYSIAAGFPIPIILALMIHISEFKFLKKLTQNVSYIPHFISTVVLVGIINQVFNSYSGLIISLLRNLGLNVQMDVLTNPDAFYHLYVWSGVWAEMGWGAIIYVSALSAVPDDLHEAAKLDGASRWKRILHVDLPAIIPTICIMLIMRFGSVMSVGYEKVYLMQNSLNIAKSEVISTYLYKEGIGSNNFSYGSAVGLMNSLINLGLVLLVNWITNKISDGENGLF